MSEQTLPILSSGHLVVIDCSGFPVFVTTQPHEAQEYCERMLKRFSGYKVYWVRSIVTSLYALSIDNRYEMVLS